MPSLTEAKLALSAGQAVGKGISNAVHYFDSYDHKKDAERQATARTLYAAALNGDKTAAAQLRCLGAQPLLAGDLALLVALGGGHDETYYRTRCGFASPPARALAGNLAKQLASNASLSGRDSGNPATLGNSAVRNGQDGQVGANSANSPIVQNAGFGLWGLLALLGILVAVPHITKE